MDAKSAAEAIVYAWYDPDTKQSAKLLQSLIEQALRDAQRAALERGFNRMGDNELFAVARRFELSRFIEKKSRVNLTTMIIDAVLKGA